MSVDHPIVHAAVGIVFNSRGEVLIAERPPGKSYPGLWEFPGGKLEADESVFEALQREFLEEVGITIFKAEPWLLVDSSYPDYTVRLNIWRVMQFSGEGRGLESQQIRWIPLHQLNQFQFLSANKVIIDNLLKSN